MRILNALQLYRFLLNAPVKEFQAFCAQYDLHLSKTEVKKLQQLLAEIPIFQLKYPLSAQITDDLKAILGESKFKQLNRLLQQYV